MANEFNLTEGYQANLLKMLQRKRFDYFPRGLHEPWLEIEEKNQFIVEKNIALKYFAPMYFFVSKSNIRLKSRINKGLKKLIQSGRFEQFFINHELIAGVLEKSNLQERKIFELSNPLISTSTQKLLDDKRLWLINF